MTQPVAAPEIPIPNPVDPTGTLTGWIVGAVSGGKQVVSGLASGADAAASGIDAIVATRRWLGVRHNWVRVYYVVSGFGLVMLGATILVRKPAFAALDATGLNPKTIVKTATKLV